MLTNVIPSELQRGQTVIGYARSDVWPRRDMPRGALPACPNTYCRLPPSHSGAYASPPNDATQDLFLRQLATLFSRRAIILGAALLVLFHATTTEQLAVGIVP